MTTKIRENFTFKTSLFARSAVMLLTLFLSMRCFIGILKKISMATIVTHYTSRSFADNVRASFLDGPALSRMFMTTSLKVLQSLSIRILLPRPLSLMTLQRCLPRSSPSIIRRKMRKHPAWIRFVEWATRPRQPAFSADRRS